MKASTVVLMTDHSSTEGSRDILATAVEMVTGRPPVQIDARHFMPGGCGRVYAVNDVLQLAVSTEGLVVTPSALIIYEIPPLKRRGFEACQRLLLGYKARCLGTDAAAWRTATEKNLTVRQFAIDGIPQMETVTLHQPSWAQAVAVFERLGEDIWARPTVGMGGADVFHVTSSTELRDATTYYATAGQDWLLARDAHNFNAEGRRHQFRVVVLDGRVIRACEHVQTNPDLPCNEGQGAVSTVLALDDLPRAIDELAISATKSLGLPFAGVDLAVEGDGVVFEVNVHPMFGSVQGLETVAIPYVNAHLAMA